tara:strand:- start:1756 stop:4065 length:2310 start_codon:yes stop_codon:yes gene_type:complete
MVPLKQGGSIVNVPREHAARALGTGEFERVTQEEVDRYDQAKAYEQGTGEATKLYGAAVTGAAEQVLSVPALMANALPGVDGQSGGKWLAEMTAGLTGEDSEDVAERLRIVGEADPGARFGGQFAGSFVGSKGLGAAGKQVLGAATKVAPGLATASNLRTAARAGDFAEDAISGVSFANEEAFITNQELTAETAMTVAILSGGAPLALRFAGGKAGQGAKAIAKKVDEKRLSSFQKTMAADKEAFRKTAVPKAQRAYDKAAKAEASEIAAAEAAVKEAKNVTVPRSYLDKAKEAHKNHVAKYQSIFDDAVKAESKATGDALKVAKKATSTAKGKLSFAKNKSGPAKRVAGSQKGFDNASARARKVYDDAKAKRDALLGRKGQGAVGTARENLNAAKRELNEFGAGEAGPTRFSDLFTGNKAKTYETAGDLFEGAADASGRVNRSVGGYMRATANYAARKGSRRVRQDMGLFSGDGLGALIGGSLLDSASGFLLGGMAGRAIAQFGPKASGMAFNSAAKHMRKFSSEAAEAALKPRAKVTPADIAMDAARVSHRARTGILVQAGNDHADQILSNPEQFAADVGDMYGELGKANNQIVGAITNQHLKAAAYLKEEAPRSDALSPAMPGRGRREPPIGEQEEYARKVRAIANPMSLLEDMSNGRLHPDAVKAVQHVYPAMYLDMQMEVLDVINRPETPPLTRKQEMQFDVFLGGKGMVYAAYRPAYQARLGVVNEEIKEANKQKAPQNKPGSSSPTLAQSMRTTSQRLMAGG